MPSSYPATPDDLTAGNTGLTHGQVSDAVAAVQATLGVNPQGASATVAARIAAIPAGATGPAGPTGATGPTGPAGADGTDGLDGRTVLSGAGAPASGSGLDPLDGVSDPWRWVPSWGGWGTFFECSWSDGDMLPHVGLVDRGAADQIEVYVSTAFDTLAQASSGDAANRPSRASRDPDPTVGDAAATLSGSGSGAVFVIQYEVDGTHTVAPEPTFDPTDPVFVGPLAIGAPIVFADVQTGVDGDFYLDTTTADLYGPKAGTWPSPVSLVGPQGDPAAEANNVILYSSPGNIAWHLIVADDGTLSTEAV